MTGGSRPALTLPGATKQNLNGSQEKVQTRFTLQQSQTQQQSPHTKQTASISQVQIAQQPAFQYSMLKAKQKSQMQVQEAVLKQKTVELLLAKMKITEILTETLPAEMKLQELLPMKTKITVLAVRKPLLNLFHQIQEVQTLQFPVHINF